MHQKKLCLTSLSANSIRAALLISVAQFAVAPVVAEEEIEYKLKVNSYLDFGHLVSGVNPDGNSAIDMLPLNRGNVTITPQVFLGESFDVMVGITGLIWWPYSADNTQPSKRVMRVKPMVPLARGKWSFGDKGGFHGHLQAGTFPYKYNTEAKNLGEYLYRSGTYPGFLFTTEGWLFMNRAGFYAHGLQMQMKHLDGMLTHNLSLFMEMTYYPIGDFSPGYDFAFKTAFLELGGGAVYHHGLPIRPSLLKLNQPNNKYVHIPADTEAAPRWQEYVGPLDLAPFEATSDPTVVPTVLHHYTHQGIKLMGRATLNLNSLLPEDRKSPEDLKIFAEVALLGVEDYPIYYEKKADRMPIMLGVNIPTFKFLDVLSVQVEHYSAPFNDITKLNQESSPIWEMNQNDYATYTDSLNAGTLENWKTLVSNQKDDWKWSIYAKKRVNGILTLYSQVASDHFRLVDSDMATSVKPLTSNPKEWYYLLRMEFGLN